MNSLHRKMRFALSKIKNMLLLMGTDYVIIAYPKTGSTWLQLMIRTLLVNHYKLGDHAIQHAFVTKPQDIFKLPKGYPRIYITHAMRGFNEEPHFAMNVNYAEFKRKKIILLIREPKDTLVSLYFHNSQRTVPPTFQAPIDDMVYDDVYGIWKYIRYYQTWYQTRNIFQDTLLVKYEELHRDPYTILSEIAQYLGLVDVSKNTINYSVDFCSFENMKKSETANAEHFPGLNRSQNPSPEAYKVREGKVKGYKKYLQEKTIQYIDQCVKENLPHLYGYQLEKN